MDDDHFLDIVNEKDEVIGQDTKNNKFEKGLLSRNVAIFLEDGNSNYIICKRAAGKKTFPNKYDAAVVGHVKAGESYQNAAQRELKEELSVGCDLQMIGKRLNEFSEGERTMRFMTGIFIGVCSQNITLNKELSSYKIIDFKTLQTMIVQHPEQFTPGLIQDFPEVVSCLKSKQSFKK